MDVSRHDTRKISLQLFPLQKCKWTENIHLHLREKMYWYPSDWKLDGSHSKFNLDAVVAGEKKNRRGRLICVITFK